MTAVHFCDSRKEAMFITRAYLPDDVEWEGETAINGGIRVIALPRGYAVVSRVIVTRHYDTRGDLETGGAARASPTMQVPFEQTLAHVVIDPRPT